MRAVPCEDAPGAGCHECLGTWRFVKIIECEDCGNANGLTVLKGKFYCEPDAWLRRHQEPSNARSSETLPLRPLNVS